MIKVLGCVGLEVIYLNTIKAIYGKPTANTIGNGETLEVITLKSGMFPTPGAIREEKNIEETIIGN